MQDSIKFDAIIDTYQEYMQEAFTLLALSKKLQEEDESDLKKYGPDIDFSRPNDYLISRLSRYAFLLAAMSLEAGANALLKSISTNSSIYDDYEKLQTLIKYEVFCLSKSKTIDRGNVLFQRVKELMTCRNEFVHPKPRTAEFESNGRIDTIVRGNTSNRKYPKYLNFILLDDAISSVSDVANFTAWVLNDICSIEIIEGASLIGFGTYGWTGEQEEICKNYKIDQRSFGKEKC